jgi:hypothetical protein
MKKLLALTASFAAFALAQSVPIPKVTPVPTTATSYPFLAASHNLTPIDLAKAGYVEEEFIISGNANVYDWAADGKLSVKAANNPYATRILVRRPSDPARFSGTALIELPNTARRADWAMMWGYTEEYLLEHGDAWILVTMPGSLGGVKKFNSTRYADLSYANPGTCPAGPNGPSDVEDGLKWDALSQVGAALKNKAVPGINVQYLFMTTQGADIVTYLNAIQDNAKVYDGFMIKGPSGPGRINSCAPAIPKGDARLTIKDVGVPVISVVPQGEVADAVANRRADSDTGKGGYRLYEIAGAAHIHKQAYVGLASVADQNATGTPAQGTPDWPFNVRCTPEIQMSAHPLLGYMFDMTLANMDAWVRKGIPAPKAERMSIVQLQEQNGLVSATQNMLVKDQFGNGQGGVRNVYVDVPTATYFTTTPGPGTCRELGYETPFDWQKMESVYGSYSNYAAKVNQSVDQMVKGRWLTETDAKHIRATVMTSASNPRATTASTR